MVLRGVRKNNFSIFEFKIVFQIEHIFKIKFQEYKEYQE